MDGPTGEVGFMESQWKTWKEAISKNEQAPAVLFRGVQVLLSFFMFEDYNKNEFTIPTDFTFKPFPLGKQDNKSYIW